MFLVVLLVLLGGCQSKQTETVKIDNQKWVVLKTPEAVKPQSGVARRLIELPNYKAIDFISDTQVLAYKYSDTVFGEDRGLVIFDIETGQVLKHFKTKGTYFQGRLAPDKKVFAYTEASRDTLLNFLDLDTGKITEMSLGQKSSVGGFSKYSMTDNFRWVSSEKAVWTDFESHNELQFEIIDTFGTTPYKIPFKTSGSTDNMSIGLSQFDVLGENFVGLISVDSTHQLVKGNLKNKQFEKVLAERISRYWALRETNQLLVFEMPDKGSEYLLKLIDLDGKLVKTLSKIENLQGAELSGRYVTYQSYGLEQGVMIHLVDLETYTVSYVTTYLKEGVGTVKVSPDGSRLLIDFEYTRPQMDGKPSSHLIELK